MAFSLLKILEPFWLFNFHLFQPQASPNPLPQSRRIPSPSHCPRVSSAPSQLLLKFWGRLLPGPGVGLAAAGSWRRGQVEVELRQATGGLGHAGLGRQKKVKKKSIGKVKKKSNVRILALADYWRQQKVKKKSNVEKVKKSQKKVNKKSKKSPKKVKKGQKKSNVKTKRGS